MGSTFSGSAASAPSSSSPSGSAIIQYFCTVADLIADKQSPGVDEARMFDAIRDASDWLQKKIGWFIPVTLTRSFKGKDSRVLFVPPLLSITSVINADRTLTTGDYLLRPENSFWANGPVAQILVHPTATNLSVWSSVENDVVITGRWGKYERSGLIGATVADAGGQSNSQTTLKVSNGGTVSPGMILLIGDEQEAINGWGDPTTNVTALNMASGMTANDEAITVDDGSLVNVGEVIRLEFEQARVKDKNSNQLELIRGWNGTRRVAHADNTQLDVYRTVNVERGVNGTTAATHTANTAISRYFV